MAVKSWHPRPSFVGMTSWFDHDFITNGCEADQKLILDFEEKDAVHAVTSGEVDVFEQVDGDILLRCLGFHPFCENLLDLLRDVDHFLFFLSPQAWTQDKAQAQSEEYCRYDNDLDFHFFLLGKDLKMFVVSICSADKTLIVVEINPSYSENLL